MGLRSLLAKGWKLDVNTSTDLETPIWTPVKGLTSFQETTDDNTEDDGDFDDEEGWGSSVVTGRTWQIEAEGRRKRTDDTVFTADLGQEAIRQAARKVGAVVAESLAAVLRLSTRVVAGSASGARVELNSSGLAVYNGSGQQTASISAATGSPPPWHAG